jgi:hypothetical protein
MQAELLHGFNDVSHPDIRNNGIPKFNYSKFNGKNNGKN